jgi:hypothetical protein
MYALAGAHQKRSGRKSIGSRTDDDSVVRHPRILAAPLLRVQNTAKLRERLMQRFFVYYAKT